MSTHYHCTYRPAPNEVFLKYRYYVICPWPYAAFDRVGFLGGVYSEERILIGLN